METIIPAKQLTSDSSVLKEGFFLCSLHDLGLLASCYPKTVPVVTQNKRLNLLTLL